jgi:N-carbamoylputrescine amidase
LFEQQGCEFAESNEKVKEAAAKGAQIVCLQELFTSLYFCDVEDYENFKLAEPIPGPSSDALSKLAKELNVVIIASLFEKRAQGIYHNTTAVLDAMVLISVSIVRCIYLMIRLTMKNSISLR